MAGGATSLASATVLERVCRAVALGGAGLTVGVLCCLGRAVGWMWGDTTATGAWVIDLVMHKVVKSRGVGTLGTVGW